MASVRKKVYMKVIGRDQIYNFVVEKFSFEIDIAMKWVI